MEFNNRHKIFYDSEFTGLHQDTSLISIGFVSESGSYFYAELKDYDALNISYWIIENVINNLMFNDRGVFRTLTKLDGSEYTLDSQNNELYNVKMKDTCYFTGINLLKWLENEYKCSGKKIQIYSDCYAYDWMLFNDLICKEGDALNIPEFIDYIPIDLSSNLLFHNIDPDINREEFIGADGVNKISNGTPFNEWNTSGDNIKHNSLWDAYVCKSCFEKLVNRSNNEDIPDSEDNLEDVVIDL